MLELTKLPTIYSAGNFVIFCISIYYSYFVFFFAHSFTPIGIFSGFMMFHRSVPAQSGSGAARGGDGSPSARLVDSVHSSYGNLIFFKHDKFCVLHFKSAF